MPGLEFPSAPEYVTNRLVLRRFVATDAEFVLELHSNPDLARFLPAATQTDVSDAAQWIDSLAESAAPGRGWWCVTLHDGTPIGAVVLKPIRYSEGHTGDEVEIGWRWHSAHTGNGYATEAAQLLLAAGFAGGLHEIIAVVKPSNLASAAVCQRIGLADHGETDEYYDQTIKVFRASAPKHQTARQVSWFGEDNPARFDSASVLLDPGLYAFGRQRTDDYVAAWTVDARSDWITQAVHVAVQGRGWSRTLALTRNAQTGQWSSRTHTGGQPPKEYPPPGIVDATTLTGAIDCDLGLCPVTNTLPIRRLRLQDHHVAARELMMAWIDMPSLQVTASRQIYASDNATQVTYTSTTRNTTYPLSLDEDGLVVRYPGLARRADA